VAFVSRLLEEDPAAAAGLSIPEPAEDEEERPWQEGYFDAFGELQFDRQYGAMGGAAPISYQTMSRYAEDHGIAGDDRRVFLVFLRILDACYLEKLARDASAKTG